MQVAKWWGIDPESVRQWSVLDYGEAVAFINMHGSPEPAHEEVWQGR